MKKLLTVILDKIGLISTANIKCLDKTVHERDQFHNMIELERNRVHRDEQQFSLILIRVNQDQNCDSAITELVRKTSERVRRIDQIGWFDNTHLGILLPNTKHSGAQIIANDICKNEKDPNSTITFETFSYPEKSNTIRWKDRVVSK